MKSHTLMVVSGAVVFLLLLMFAVSGSVRAGQEHPPATLGGPLDGLTTSQTRLFNDGLHVFTTKWDPIAGLGPVFTQAGCFSCHGGGTGVPTGTPGSTSMVMATRYGRFNDDGTFNYLDGTGSEPVNEGGPILHTQSVIQFGQHLRHCNLQPEVVPADATVVSLIHSPQLFGDGLIDSINESDILANAVDKGMGIHGVANMVPDQNGILHVGRFGMKDSIPNLLMFTASAMMNEIGITNPLFPDKHLPQGQPIPSGCVDCPTSPNDVTGHFTIGMYQFAALLAPNTPLPPTQQILDGKATFESIGCNLCHVESFQTPLNVTVSSDMNGNTIGTVNALSNQAVNLYSDLLLHDMGTALAGGIPLGQAALTQWRTAPLWGLSTRRSFGFMHDSNAKTINDAILAHGGEAAQVLSQYQALTPNKKSDVFVFLSSL